MEIKLLSCPLCLKPHFEGVDSLRSTLVSVATSHLSCPVCSESLLGLDKLTIHLFSHINGVIENTRNGQEETIHEEIDKSIENISNHKDEISENADDCTSVPINSIEDKHVRCDICNFGFTDQNLLDMHQKLLHQTIPDQKTGLYSYHCHLCSKKFKMRGSLMVHLRVAHYGFVHHNNDVGERHLFSEKVEDTEDNRSLQEVDDKEINENLKTIPQKIQDNKQWECDICSKMFTTKYFLKKHKRLHTGEMPYCCALCNKSFTFQQSYHKHMLYHSSEKPYVCNECGRAFKELSTLQNHARIHSGERPFGCETCGKRFRQRVSYLVHRRIHTGVMPYKCTACEKSFRYKVSQRSHKCPMNPPGFVIRVPEVSEQSVLPKQESATSTESTSNSVKCIMSVDYNTGNINFISEEQTPLNVLYVPNAENKFSENLEKQSIILDNKERIEISYNKSYLQSKLDRTETSQHLRDADVSNNERTGLVSNNALDLDETPQNQPFPVNSIHQDLFSIVLSPLIPEVNSLCLSSSESCSTKLLTPEVNLQVNEGTIDAFLYERSHSISYTN